MNIIRNKDIIKEIQTQLESKENLLVSVKPLLHNSINEIQNNENEILQLQENCSRFVFPFIIITIK